MVTAARARKCYGEAVKKAGTFLAVALALAYAGIAEAHGGSRGGGSRGGGHSGGAWHGSASSGHWHGGGYRPYWGRGAVFVGAPYYGFPYYYYPAYYPPAYPYPPAPYYYPPVTGYVEQAPAGAQSDWLYCPQARAYYPQVQDCPGGWQRIPPQPAPGPSY